VLPLNLKDLASASTIPQIISPRHMKLVLPLNLKDLASASTIPQIISPRHMKLVLPLNLKDLASVSTNSTDHQPLTHDTCVAFESKEALTGRCISVYLKDC
jgi:hypothetical protein